MYQRLRNTLSVALIMGVSTLHGAYVIEIDTDGLDDGVIAYNPDFAYGGDTTSASQSATSTAIGLSGGDSIFGGNGVTMLDTYLYTYAPDSQTDNLFLGPGTPLGAANIATGATGGVPGRYAVYASWTASSNVSGGLTNYLIETGIDTAMSSIDQNGPGGLGSLDLFGNIWVKIGEVEYASGPITVTQTPTLDSFVSMRAAGMMFELIADVSAVYDGPPGAVIFGAGIEEYLGIAFERNKVEAQSTHHAVVRSTDLQNWATSDLKLFSVVDLDPDTELVTFRSMTPMAGGDREFLGVQPIPKMEAVYPYIAMTFDDGPGLTTTPALLDILAARNIRATFFIVGNQANVKPQVLRRIINEGHEIGNHSTTHVNLTTIPLDDPDPLVQDVVGELAGCNDAIIGAATVPPTKFRAPYGALDPAIRDLVTAQFGYPHIGWDVDSLDYTFPGQPQEVVDEILAGVAAFFAGSPAPGNGPIVLAHDIHQQTIDAMPIVLDALLAQGYTFVTVSELVELRGF